MNESMHEKLSELGVFPITVLERAEDALPLGEALLEAGLPCVEVTFRTEAAAAAIENFAKEFPELLVGAGTVLSTEQAQQAFDSGARFILSPGFNPTVVDYCLDKKMAVYPGVCTPTEIEAALGKGLRVLKFFPAEAMGGVSFLKAISAPLSMVRYLPTGGVNLDNLADYLAFDRVLACAGTWIVRREWVARGEFERIRQTAAAALEVVKKIRSGGND